MTTRRHVVPSLILTVLVVGCGPTEMDAGREGGVVSPEPTWAADAGWVVSPEPILRLGEWTGNSEAFDGIRAARHISPDEIAVLDGTTASARVFDLTGALVMQIGREGDGPGEFRFPNHIEVLRDTLYVADAGLRRVNLFDRTGTFLDLVQLPQDLPGSPWVVGVYPSGDFLLQDRGRGSRVVQRAGPLPPDSTTWYRYSPSSGSIAPLASGVAMEVYGHPWRGNFALGEVIFGAPAHATLDGDTLLLARAEHGFEVDLIDPSGAETGWFGLSTAATPTTPRDVDRYVEWRIQNAPSSADTEAFRRVFAEAPVRETFPPTGVVLSMIPAMPGSSTSRDSVCRNGGRSSMLGVVGWETSGCPRGLTCCPSRTDTWSCPIETNWGWKPSRCTTCSNALRYGTSAATFDLPRSWPVRAEMQLDAESPPAVQTARACVRLRLVNELARHVQWSGKGSSS